MEIPATTTAGGRRVDFAVPLQLLFAISVAAAMMVLAATLIWQGWTAGRNALLTATSVRAVSMAKLIGEQIERRLEPAGVALGYLTRGPLARLEDRKSLLSSLPVFKIAFDNMPFLAGIVVGYGDGTLFTIRQLAPDFPENVRAPADAAFLVETTFAEPDQPRRAIHRFYDEALNLLETRDAGPATLDPRSSDWFSKALNGQGPHLTAPYVFALTGRLGVTLSEKIEGLDAVAGLDGAVFTFGAELEPLLPTPKTEFALIGEDGTATVLAGGRFRDRELNRALIGKPLSTEQAPALATLRDRNAPPGQAITYFVNGEKWIGVTSTRMSRAGTQYLLLTVTPEHEILSTLRTELATQMWLAGAITLGLVLLGAFAGRRLGGGLAELSERAQRLTRFDFRPSPPVRSLIREIGDFEAVLDTACLTIRNFLATTDLIATEPSLDLMLQEVLVNTVRGTACRGGAVYLADEEAGALRLAAEASASGEGMADVPHELPFEILTADQRADGLPGHDPGRFVLPLHDRGGRRLGLLVLLFDSGEADRGDDFRAFARKLSGILAVSIETRKLIETQKRLLEGFIHLIADAIDAKSPYTGAHCRRVPELATMIVNRMANERDGPYREFHLTTDEREAFHLGAWLHDCGKVTSPEHIIDKATKLEAVHNRIHEVLTRFEVLWRDAEIAHLERLMDGADPAVSKARLLAEQEALTDDFAFVAKSNIGGEFMSDAAVERLRQVACRSWLRHFDDRLGLSREEEARRAAHPAGDLPVREPLLADRPEHVTAWAGSRPPVEKDNPANRYGFDMKLPANRQNLGEIYNLSIRRGTLNDEERFKVNDHVVETYIMLKRLPWPEPLMRVPEIAATHHERMDGNGYPRRIGADGLTIPERVMAIADVFEALTAADRPYKPAKSLSEALHIMAGMAMDGHLDPQVFSYFLASRLWQDYGERFMQDAQRDTVDVNALVARVAGATMRAG